MAAGSADADVIVLAAQVGLFSGHGAGACVPVETGDGAFKSLHYIIYGVGRDKQYKANVI